MTEENKPFIGDAINDSTQRRRIVKGSSQDEADEIRKKLMYTWGHEATYYMGQLFDDKFDTVKQKALELTISYPTPPEVSVPVIYKSVMGRTSLKTESQSKIHLDDLRKFRSSIKKSEDYRLQKKLANRSLNYPVNPPAVRRFQSSTPNVQRSGMMPVPASPKRPVPIAPVIKWYDKLFFWRRLTLLSDAKANNFENEKKYLEESVRYREHKEAIDSLNSWLTELYEDRQAYWQMKKEDYEKKCNKDKELWEENKAEWLSKHDDDLKAYEDPRDRYVATQRDGITEYFRLNLNSIPLPHWCHEEYELEFDDQENILLLEVRLPYLANKEVLKTKQYKSGPKYVSCTQKEHRDFSNQVPYLIVLRYLWEVAQTDYEEKVGFICCNGYVIYDDPATGQKRRDVIMSVAAKQEDLVDIKLWKVEPDACFRGLKGISAAKISDLVPIQPIIVFNKDDNRFIKSREVLDSVGDTNLATMDWQDFEHLIRELFEREFCENTDAEVKVTQASRDRGVDAIVFDPDPIRGGKFVIQAKRYVNTVELAAVRELYATVVTEGANRGFLVTTSNYGRDAHDYAKDKPITLINGNNLLQMLDKHGYHLSIDLKEAKRILKAEQTEDLIINSNEPNDRDDE